LDPRTFGVTDVDDSISSPLNHEGRHEGSENGSTRQPGLHWAVKRTFFNYLARLTDSRMSVTGGATLTDQNEVLWEAAPNSAPAVPRGADRVLTFSGDLRCAGHGGLLFVRVADPHVVLSGDMGELSVVETFSTAEGSRIPLVTFGVAHRAYADGCEVLSTADVRLTDRGAEVFSMNYPAGELFEPITVIWPDHPPLDDDPQPRAPR
jgi:hypothetical protein